MFNCQKFGPCLTSARPILALVHIPFIPFQNMKYRYSEEVLGNEAEADVCFSWGDEPEYGPKAETS